MDSRVVDGPRSSNPLVVTLFTWKSGFCNGLQYGGALLGLWWSIRPRNPRRATGEREDQGDRQRRSPGLSMPCSLRRTWRFFRSAVHSPTSSVARKHAERGESAGCHAGTGPYALCNKVGHHAGAGPVGALSLTGLGPGPRRPGCCPKTSRPTTNSTLICELSCRARYAGKIAPCVSCTDNGCFSACSAFV